MRSSITHGLIALLVALAFVGCKSKQSTGQANVPNIKELAQNPGDLLLFYRRTSCFGTCPVFELKVYSSGYAVYHGKNFVEMEGVFEGVYGKDNVVDVILKADEIGYWSLDTNYDNKLVSDLPAVITSIKRDGKTHEVKNRYKGPEILQELYIVIDGHIETTEWNQLSDLN